MVYSTVGGTETKVANCGEMVTGKSLFNCDDF